jgi:hypothetical protein
MMKRKLREIYTDEAMEVIHPLLYSVGLSNVQTKTALSDFQAGSGLLLEREAGQWSFAHLTFQEFLTAAHWLEDKNAAPDWSEIVSDSWWHETLRLYAAQGDATWIAKACLSNDSVPALTLAFECAEEARKLDAGTRAEINARLIEGLESDDLNLRRIAAEVQLARRLKSLQRIDDKCEIDLTYLTCVEYQLFLDDMRAQGNYCQPDHWTDFTFTKGWGREPVCGVRYEDAVEFCKWLTERQGGETLFRLPFASEAEKWQPENVHIAAWCGDQQSPVGLPPGIELELRRKLMALTPARLPLLQLIASDLDFDLAGLLLARDLVRARNRDRDRDPAAARPLARARALTVDLARDRAVAYARNRALALDGDHALYRDRALDLALALDRDHALDLALAFPTFDIQGFARAIERGAFAEAQRLVEDLMYDSNSAVARWGGLLSALLAIAAAENPIEMRAAQRRYAACIYEYIYNSFVILEKKGRPWWRRLLRNREKGNWKEEKQIALDAYWWLQIVRLREEGNLDAWEGIRIVREQVDS